MNKDERIAELEREIERYKQDYNLQLANKNVEIEILRKEIKRLENDLYIDKKVKQNRCLPEEYIDYSLVYSLVKPCPICGDKPQLENIVGYEGKYSITCMNRYCVNHKIINDNNLYNAIERWNKFVEEILDKIKQ